MLPILLDCPAVWNSMSTLWFLFFSSVSILCALTAARIHDLVHFLQKLLCDHITSVMSDKEGAKSDILGVDHGQRWQLKGKPVRTGTGFPISGHHEPNLQLLSLMLSMGLSVPQTLCIIWTPLMKVGVQMKLPLPWIPAEINSAGKSTSLFL